MVFIFYIDRYECLREEGARALYNGLVPGLQRQMCFASVRIGLYDAVKDVYCEVSVPTDPFYKNGE